MHGRPPDKLLRPLPLATAGRHEGTAPGDNLASVRAHNRADPTVH
ncbi:hypothetical protein SF06_30650 [Pseudomonas flexibilis]|nr:hypothetical protein SF06_30650 [Pseudomonas flexibilis]